MIAIESHNEVEALAETAPRRGLTSPSFIGLLVTQFLGALNDNMFRWLAVPIAKDAIDEPNALALGLACFTVPYLVLATPAGYLADRFSKRIVIVACKLAEILIMLLGIAAILLGSLSGLFVVVALMGAQSALFSPAKFGSIPEMLPDEKLSTGNGLMGLITIVASALGFMAGNWLYSLTEPSLRHPGNFAQIQIAAMALVGVAVVGWLASWTISRLPAANPHCPPPINPFSGTGRYLRLLSSDVPLFRTSLGIAFFWLLASLVQVTIDSFGIGILQLEQQSVGILGAVLVVGLGLGSLLAGLWSGGRVELGIVPLGATGIVISSLLLFSVGRSVDPAMEISAQQAFYWSCLWLFMLGIAAGLFNIPLESYLQHRSPVQTRGSILAASNFISFAFILASSGLFWLMRTQFELSATEIFLVAGLGTIPVALYIFSLLPTATIRFVVWLASKTIYRIRIHGRENLPETGGALLVANHVSWLDGILLIMTSTRPIRMIAYADYIQGFGIRWLARLFGVIPIKGDSGPKAVMRALKEAREAVQNGELVGIFAEGSITRTGQLQPFQRGLMRIIAGTSAPVIPVYLDELWGSIFSYHGGKFFWKRPRQWPYPITILFGTPLREPSDVTQVRQAVEVLGVDAVENRKDRQMIPPRLFLRQCKSSLFRSKVADSMGLDLTGSRLLTGTLVLKRVLERDYLSPDERMVGILLPPAVGGVLANTSLTLSGRVTVNLNYTLDAHVLNYCIEQCGIKHVITSRRFLEKKPFELNAEFIFLEDLKEKATGADKLISALQTFLLPVSLLEQMHGLTKVNPDDLMTVIFTSGSTGKPKGVMLSHRNVGSNIDAVNQLFQLQTSDVVLGVLPFFHSFGFTLTHWLVLTSKPKGVYHFNPLDGRQIGKLCEQHAVTIVMATPTFLRTYLKRCDKEQLKHLDLAIVGAEKLPDELTQAFREKFGVVPTEGYGTTELSPLATANVPDHRSALAGQKGTKLGTVGRMVPNTTAKIVHPETGEELGANREGLLLIKGPNVMLGYLNDSEKTAQVVQDGWYNTGDIGKIDEDGFISITGRLSRFSKIGGEMVPHGLIEDYLARIVADPEEEEPTLKIAVTAVPDEQKGERLVVLHRPLKKPVQQVIQELAATGLPNLFIPSADSFVQVEEIPILGTGKLDLRGVRQLAEKKFGRETVQK